MNAVYPTIEEDSTAEYVLAVLRDQHRQQCRYDPESDLDASLSFGSTVAEWRAACDLVGWRELGRAHNQLWGIDLSDAEWQTVLEPAHQKRLDGVCDLIARYSRRRKVRPAYLFASSCRAAGAFLTIRSLLQHAGVPAAKIAPSTPLAPYTRRYSSLFLGSISQLAPGALPLVRFRTPIYDAAIWGILFGLLCLPVGACSGLPLLTIAGGLLIVLAYLLTWISAGCMLPASVEFGELRTFRELALVIADGSAAEPDALLDRSGTSVP